MIFPIKKRTSKRTKPHYNELTKKYGSYSTPTVVIDGKAIIGFEIEKIKQELNLE